MHHKLVTQDLPRDIRISVYDHLSIDDLYRLMSVSKEERQDVLAYLELVLSNPQRFFLRLVNEKESAEKLPVGAMMLLNRFHKKYEMLPNPILAALSVDGKFITCLFDEYEHNGKALSLICNAITRIVPQSIINQLASNQQLASYHYALITDDINKLDIKKIKEDVNRAYKDKGIIPLPLMKAIELIEKGRESRVRHFDYSESQRAWDDSCFPVNLSGTPMIWSDKIGSLCCAVLINMVGYRNYSGRDYTICLYGANLSYDRAQLLGSENINSYVNCDMRYSFLLTPIPARRLNYHVVLIDCNLSYSTIIGLDLNFLDVTRCNFTNARLLHTKIHTSSPDADDIQGGNDPNHLHYFAFMDMNEALIYSSLPWAVSDNTLINKCKEKLLTSIEIYLNNATSLNDMGQLYRIFKIDCHLLKLNRGVLHMLISTKGPYSRADFCKRTESWKKFICLIKSRCQDLMNNSNPASHVALTKDTELLLERLKHESSSSNFFARADSHYASVYDKFNSALIVIKNNL